MTTSVGPRNSRTSRYMLRFALVLSRVPFLLAHSASRIYLQVFAPRSFKALQRHLSQIHACYCSSTSSRDIHPRGNTSIIRLLFGVFGFLNLFLFTQHLFNNKPAVLNLPLSWDRTWDCISYSVWFKPPATLLLFRHHWPLDSRGAAFNNFGRAEVQNGRKPWGLFRLINNVNEILVFGTNALSSLFECETQRMRRELQSWGAN